MYCRKCGTELAQDARFCKKCGAAVRDGSSSPAAGTAGETKPVAAAKPAPAAKPTPVAKPAAKANTDKIDVKLIVAVMAFLVIQLAAVSKVVSSVDAGGKGAAGLSPLPVEPVGNITSSDYFGDALYVGGKVEFGRYEQDGDSRNGPEPIEWDVVASYEDGYLLVSRYILDGIPWDDGSGDPHALDLKAEITYEWSSIRKWIRDDFVYAFTEEERALIVPVAVQGEDVVPQQNSRFATDYAFILRDDEVVDCWGRTAVNLANAALPCAPTKHAAQSGLALDSTGRARHSYGDNFQTAQWVLRRRYTDERSKKTKVVTVDTAGRFSNAVVTETLGFRPALYLKY